MPEIVLKFIFKESILYSYIDIINLLKHHVSTDIQYHNNTHSPLVIAYKSCTKNKQHMIELLLDLGYGCKGLFDYMVKKQTNEQEIISLTKVIMDKKPNLINYRSNEISRFLVWCVKNKYQDTALKLIHQNADYDYKQNNKSVLLCAIENSLDMVVNAILEKVRYIAPQDASKLLKGAVKTENLKLVKRLIKIGVRDEGPGFYKLFLLLKRNELSMDFIVKYIEISPQLHFNNNAFYKFGITAFAWLLNQNTQYEQLMKIFIERGLPNSVKFNEKEKELSLVIKKNEVLTPIQITLKSMNLKFTLLLLDYGFSTQGCIPFLWKMDRNKLAKAKPLNDQILQNKGKTFYFINHKNFCVQDNKEDLGKFVLILLQEKLIQTANIVLQLVPQISKKTAFDETALHLATDLNQYETVKQILSHNVNKIYINDYDTHNKNPLINAVTNLNVELVSLLLKNGASPNGDIQKDVTPLSKLLDLCKIARNNEDKYVLEQIFKLLFSYGADANHPYDRNHTLLTMAAKYNLPQVSKLLLDAGASYSIRNKAGETAKDIASHNQYSMENYNILAHYEYICTLKKVLLALCFTVGAAGITVTFFGFQLFPLLSSIVTSFLVSLICQHQRLPFTKNNYVKLILGVAALGLAATFLILCPLGVINPFMFSLLAHIKTSVIVANIINSICSSTIVGILAFSCTYLIPKFLKKTVYSEYVDDTIYSIDQAGILSQVSKFNSVLYASAKNPVEVQKTKEKYSKPKNNKLK